MGLSERKFRFALNLIGIMIGCAAIIGLIGITEGLSVNINAQLGTLGTNTINVVPERTQGPQAQFESGSERARGTFSSYQKRNRIFLCYFH